MLEVHAHLNVTVPEGTDNPFLQGLFRPVGTEYTADTDDMAVIGTIPDDLHGMYMRNSHNQMHAPMGTYHPFDGDGTRRADRPADADHERHACLLDRGRPAAWRARRLIDPARAASACQSGCPLRNLSGRMEPENEDDRRP